MTDPTMTVEKAEKAITFTRHFEASRELVFEAFSKAEHIKEWWGPDEWPVSYCTVDFRPGGIWHYCMTNAAGDEIWVKAIYQEIVFPERITYLNGVSDAAGDDSTAMKPAFVTITLTELAGITTVTANLEYATAQDLEVFVLRGMAEGYREVFNHLEAYLLARTGAKQ